MHQTIWQYIIPTPEEKSSLWDSCVFVFDTNVLLNLYRFTSNARTTLLDALEEVKDRVWIPHQVAYEYAKNRCNVIFETCDKYNKIEEAQETFVNSIRKELMLKTNDESLKKLTDFLDKWLAEEKRKNILVSQASSDEILDRLMIIFDGKVGKAYSEEDLEKIKTEGKQRYEKQIPPGFCDVKKAKDGKDNNEYGDFIVWKEILDFSAENHRDIVYVTHDNKEDWWATSKGRIVGPRAELREEFASVTKQNFYMYSIDAFLGQFSDHRGQKADQEVIEEMTDMLEVSRKKDRKASRNYDAQIKNKEKIQIIRERIVRKQNAIKVLEEKYRGKIMPVDVLIQVENTKQNIYMLEKQLQNAYDMQKILIIEQQRYMNENDSQ